MASGANRAPHADGSDRRSPLRGAPAAAMLRAWIA